MVLPVITILTLLVMLADDGDDDSDVAGGCSDGEVDNDSDVKTDRSVESATSGLYISDSQEHRAFNFRALVFLAVK